MRLIYLISLFIILSNQLLAGSYRADNYKITITTYDSLYSYVNVDCEFDLIRVDTISTDSLFLKFGGQLKEYSIDDLKISLSNKKIKWKFYPKRKLLVFYTNKSSKEIIKVKMSYLFLSLSVKWIYRGVCEFWQNSYNEYYYPYIFGDIVNMDIKIKASVNNYIICSFKNQGFKKLNDTIVEYNYSAQKITSNSLVFGILPKTIYKKRFLKAKIPIVMYYIDSIPIPENRIKELYDISYSGLQFYKKKLTYIKNKNLNDTLTYAFHTNGFSNRNNGSFIIASQYKFASKPHILPLVHEIGHRWYGEWNLLIEDGQPAAYFIKESINEYLTTVFAKEYYGKEYYDSLYVKDYVKRYKKIYKTDKDKSLYSMEYNNNNTVVYRKGVIICSETAKKMGEENWISFLREFYIKYNNKTFVYSDFLNLLKEKDKESALYLDSLIKDKTSVF